MEMSKNLNIENLSPVDRKCSNAGWFWFAVFLTVLFALGTFLVYSSKFSLTEFVKQQAAKQSTTQATNTESSSADTVSEKYVTLCTQHSLSGLSTPLKFCFPENKQNNPKVAKKERGIYYQDDYVYLEVSPSWKDAFVCNSLSECMNKNFEGLKDIGATYTEYKEQEFETKHYGKALIASARVILKDNETFMRILIFKDENLIKWSNNKANPFWSIVSVTHPQNANNQDINDFVTEIFKEINIYKPETK